MRTYKVKTVTRDIEIVLADFWKVELGWIIFVKGDFQTHHFNISQVVSIELCAE